MNNRRIVLLGRMNVQPSLREIACEVLRKSPPLNWEKHDRAYYTERLLSKKEPPSGERTVSLVQFGEMVSSDTVLQCPPAPDEICGGWGDLVALFHTTPFSLPRKSPIVALQSFFTDRFAPFGTFNGEADNQPSYGMSWGNPDRWSADCWFLFVGPTAS